MAAMAVLYPFLCCLLSYQNRWSFETGTASEITELIAGCNNESVLGRCTLLRHLKTTFRVCVYFILQNRDILTLCKQYDRSEKDSENISHYLVHRAIDDAYISIDRRQSSTLHIPSYSGKQALFFGPFLSY